MLHIAGGSQTDECVHLRSVLGMPTEKRNVEEMPGVGKSVILYHWSGQLPALLEDVKSMKKEYDKETNTHVEFAPACVVHMGYHNPLDIGVIVTRLSNV